MGSRVVRGSCLPNLAFTHQKALRTISSYEVFSCLEPMRCEYIYYGRLPTCSLDHRISCDSTESIRLWENAKVAACILKIGGNFCRQFHTLAAIVLFVYTQ